MERPAERFKNACAAGLDAGFVHGVVFISTPEELKRLGARPLNP